MQRQHRRPVDQTHLNRGRLTAKMRNQIPTSAAHDCRFLRAPIQLQELILPAVRGYPTDFTSHRSATLIGQSLEYLRQIVKKIKSFTVHLPCTLPPWVSGVITKIAG